MARYKRIVQIKLPTCYINYRLLIERTYHLFHSYLFHFVMKPWPFVSEINSSFEIRPNTFNATIKSDHRLIVFYAIEGK